MQAGLVASWKVNKLLRSLAIRWDARRRQASIKTLQRMIESLEADNRDNLRTIEAIKNQMYYVDGNQPDLLD
jgi:hypothetical protein